MLVLTRRIGEAVVVPGVGLRVVVLGVSGGRVRLGLLAPPTVEVLREELQTSAPLAGKAAGRAPAHER